MYIKIKENIEIPNGKWYSNFKGCSFQASLDDDYFVLDNHEFIYLKQVWPQIFDANTIALTVSLEHCDEELEKKPIEIKQETKIRRFPSGAIRSDNTGRERFDWISPLALKSLAEYLSTTENSFAQINYFKGIPEEACVESVLRHVNDFQINGHKKEAVALLFNAVALVHTMCLRERGEYKELYPSTEIINKSDYKEE